MNTRLFGLGVIAVAGILLGLILPLNAGDTLAFFKEANDLVIRFASFLLVPLLFFQVLLNTYTIRPHGSRQFSWRIISQLFLTGIIAAGLAALLVLVFLPDRLPVGKIESIGLSAGGLEQILQNIVPGSILEIFGGSKTFLVGAFILAVIIGLVVYQQRGSSRLLLEFSDNTFTILERLNHYFILILPFTIIITTTFRTLSIRSVPDSGNFGATILLVGIPVILLTLIIFPIWLIASSRLKHFGDWLRLLLLPGLYGASSGDSVSTYSPLYHAFVQNRSTKVGHRLHMAAIGLFCKPGTIFVLTVCFLQIVRSYTSLELSVLDISFAAIGALVTSLLLPVLPNQNLVICLLMLTSVYGSGFEQGYLVIQPILPIVAAAAILLDVATQSFLLLWSGFPDIGDDEKRQARTAHLLSDYQITR